MATSRRRSAAAGRRAGAAPMLEKCPTGIQGLDEITEGGLPRGRPTLVCGAAGSGKTLLGMEFLVRGARDFGEPGVFMSFEETDEELVANVASLGFDVRGLIRRGKMALDWVRIERSEIQETGEYDLEGLFVRIDAMVGRIGARRIVLDSLEALFSGLPNEAILRAELRRLFRWLKDKGLTAVITAEQGHSALTRHGLEEYVSDCVIFLDHRIFNQVSTRRLRVVKYRGSKHGTNEYPTLIDENGLSVLPISSLGLDYPVGTERISTGVARLDAMFGGEGYYRGSTVLISGTAGTGKTSLAAAFAESTCRAGGKAMYMSFEESSAQIVRNMRSIGIDLDRWQKRGRLKFHTVRPTMYGLEMHLATVHKLVDEFRPDVLVMDPVSNLSSVSRAEEAQAMLVRTVDFLKNMGVTALFTSLTGGGQAPERSDAGISSLMDTWILVRMAESANERNRLLYVLKSRGMAHSKQMREFELSGEGIRLLDVYVGPGEVLTGSARLMQEARDKARATVERRGFERRQRELEQERASLRAQAGAIAKRLADVEAESRSAATQDRDRLQTLASDRRELAQARKAD